MTWKKRIDNHFRNTKGNFGNIEKRCRYLLKCPSSSNILSTVILILVTAGVFSVEGPGAFAGSERADAE